jgi:hypothetical protein
LDEGFDGTALRGWTTRPGDSWKVTGGSLVVGSTSSPGAVQAGFTGDQTWTDVTVDVKATLLSGDGYGVYFRATQFNSSDALLFQYDAGSSPGEFSVRRVMNGIEGDALARATPPVGFQWMGKQRDIRIESVGPGFRVSVDGTEVLSGTETTLTRGAIGLRTSGGAARFDDLRVTTK